MQLFTTSLPKPEIEDDKDVHTESRVVGYCEFCWGQDSLHRMVLLHDPTGNHIMGHVSCFEHMSGVEFCTC